MKEFRFCLISFIFILSGCSVNGTPTSKEIDRDGIDAVVIDNSTKATYIKQHGHSERFCGYRESDTEAISAEGLSLGFSTAAGQENIGAQAGGSTMALGGRSPMVLILREMLYRACELSMNLNTDKKDTMAIYKLFFEQTKALAAMEKKTGSAAKGINFKASSNSSIQTNDDDKYDNNKDNNSW